MEERVQFRPDAGTDPQSIPFGEANPFADRAREG